MHQGCSGSSEPYLHGSGREHGFHKKQSGSNGTRAAGLFNFAVINQRYRRQRRPPKAFWCIARGLRRSKQLSSLCSVEGFTTVVLGVNGRPLQSCGARRIEHDVKKSAAILLGWAAVHAFSQTPLPGHLVFSETLTHMQAREDLIDRVCKKEMGVYSQIFSSTGETAALDRMERR